MCSLAILIPWLSNQNQCDRPPLGASISKYNERINSSTLGGYVQERKTNRIFAIAVGHGVNNSLDAPQTRPSSSFKQPASQSAGNVKITQPSEYDLPSVRIALKENIELLLVYILDEDKMSDRDLYEDNDSVDSKEGGDSHYNEFDVSDWDWEPELEYESDPDDWLVDM
jgi:hypothetical protein